MCLSFYKEKITDFLANPMHSINPLLNLQDNTISILIGENKAQNG